MGTASAASISAKLRHRRTELRWLHVVLLCWKWGRGRRRLKSEALRAGGAQRVWGGRRKMKKTDELFMEQNKPLNRTSSACTGNPLLQPFSASTYHPTFSNENLKSL
ncbi:uncharacterized protein LOC143660720 isoform X3 [Tamandua tetradactyla]|uniref:uncharacterized protein LOC143660720 isoform X3 n=1 Tax=Tamandua tetradactyla TaxID=48850 RepID=UPI004054298D